MHILLSLLPLLLVTAPAWPEQVTLRPPATSVELRSYGFGLIPLDGKFTRFHGWMRYDPANADSCSVRLEIEAGSLEMANETILDRITGPAMMDAARFPDMIFDGTCQGGAVAGALTLHGETHPVTFVYSRPAGTIVVTGEIHRADWGIVGSPLIGGPTIRIKATLPDPVAGSRT